ncbi:MAG: carboxypeptidase regulatory-like domain-containing protein [Nannocystaceae bacterium]|nr:carboxypeptidase regulatory-like domain-containing protein [Nannocystaceae bacterium]
MDRRATGRLLLVLCAAALALGWWWRARTPSREDTAAALESSTPRTAAAPANPRRGDGDGSDARSSTRTPMRDAELLGRVTARDGTAIADAAIALDGGVVAHTDEIGGFALSLQPGPHTVSARAAGFRAPPEPLAIGVAPGRARRLTLVLDAIVALELQLVDEHGEAVADAQIVVIEDDDRDATPPQRLRSDARGRARAELVAAAIVDARHDDAGWVRARVLAPPPGDRVASQRLVLRQDGAVALARLRGRVVDEAGAPIAGARVAVVPGPPRTVPALAPSTRTDHDGAFELLPIDAVATDVIATRAGLAPARAWAVPPDTRDLVLVMPRGATITGALHDGDGASVSPAEVLAVLDPRGATPETLARVEVLDGRYALEGLPSGLYDVIAQAPGLAPATARDVVVDGVTPARVDLVLPQGATIHGRVHDGAAGLSGAWVALDGVDGGARTFHFGATTTDADGGFALSGLLPGRHSLTASAPGHVARTISGITIAAGEDEQGPIDVALQPRTQGGAQFELVGIGAELGRDEDALAVLRVLEGGGAAEAGIVAGESIVAVDGVDVGELGYADAVQAIRGRLGTTVRLRVLGSAGERELIATRRRVTG